MNNPCTHCENARHYEKGKTGKQKDHFCKIGTCEKRTKHIQYLKSKQKYQQGEEIKSIDELLEQKFVYVFGVVKHIEFVKHLQFATILQLISLKRIFKAYKKTEVNNLHG